MKKIRVYRSRISTKCPEHNTDHWVEIVSDEPITAHQAHRMMADCPDVRWRAYHWAGWDNGHDYVDWESTGSEIIGPGAEW